MEKFVFDGLSLPIKPQVAGEYLMQLYKQNNHSLTAPLLLKESKKKSALFHNYFEWNNDKAAVKYRLIQARKIIAAVSIVKKDGNNTITVRAFVNIRHDEKGNLSRNPFEFSNSSYVSITDVMQDTPMKKYTLDMAMRDLEYFKNKYSSLKELSDLFNFLDDNFLKKGK